MLRDKAFRVTLWSYQVALILLAAADLLTGCSDAAGYTPDTEAIKAQVAGSMAFHTPQGASKKPEPKRTCTECKGTKTVLSGDGLMRVACPCGEGCQCVKTSTVAESGEPVAENRMLMFTATWCDPCQTWKQNCVAELEKQGWVIAPYREAHIQTINTDDHGEMMEDYNISSWPTFIMVDPSGKEVARHVGNDMTAYQTGEFFYDNQQLPRSSYPPASVEERDVDEQVMRFESQPAMVTRRSKVISRGCRGGRCF